MTTQETFRIYPTQESFKAQSSDWTEITGEIHFDKSVLITSDGKEFRLNFSKYSLNDPWEDIDSSNSEGGIVWFIPLDDYKWHFGTVYAETYYGFKENNQWFVHLYDNDVNRANTFEVFDKNRTFSRCLKIIRKDGVDRYSMCFTWATNKSIMNQVRYKKVRYTKMTKPQDQMPTAFVDDANQEEVIGYIYPVI